MTTLLEVHEVSRHYGAFRALHQVSFKVAPQETLAIIGPNGAGKTTLFRVLTGEIGSSGGRISFKDEDITDVPADERVRRGIGRTFQVARVFPEYSALENVIVAVEARNRSQRQSSRSFGQVRPHAQVRDEAAARLEDLGLTAVRHIEARHLSLGDRKRLELALSLALEPVLLMMDEPTAGMSPTERQTIVGLMDRIRRELGLTIVLTEHDMDLVFRLADRIVVMNQGQLIVIGTPAEIRDSPIVQEIYLGKEMIGA